MASFRFRIFTYQSTEGKKYTFFSRENAQKYIKSSSELFSEDTEIEIVKNENVDLERLIEG